MPATSISKPQRAKITEHMSADYKIAGIAMVKVLTPATVTVIDAKGYALDYIRVSQHQRLLKNATGKIK